MGAHVIANNSSQAKMDRLKALVADCVINYKEVPEWGAEAKRIANGAGVGHITEVGLHSAWCLGRQQTGVQGHECLYRRKQHQAGD